MKDNNMKDMLEVASRLSDEEFAKYLLKSLVKKLMKDIKGKDFYISAPEMFKHISEVLTFMVCDEIISLERARTLIPIMDNILSEFAEEIVVEEGEDENIEYTHSDRIGSELKDIIQTLPDKGVVDLVINDILFFLERNSRKNISKELVQKMFLDVIKNFLKEGYLSEERCFTINKIAKEQISKGIIKDDLTGKETFDVKNITQHMVSEIVQESNDMDLVKLLVKSTIDYIRFVGIYPNSDIPKELLKKCYSETLNMFIETGNLKEEKRETIEKLGLETIEKKYK